MSMFHVDQHWSWKIITMEFVYIRMMLNMDQEVDSKYVNTLNREHVKHCLTN